MAQGVFIGNNGKAKKIKNIFIGVNGKAQKVSKAYIGVNGIAQQFYPGYVWNRYNTITTITYKWNRYTIVTRLAPNGWYYNDYCPITNDIVITIWKDAEMTREESVYLSTSDFPCYTQNTSGIGIRKSSQKDSLKAYEGYVYCTDRDGYYDDSYREMDGNVGRAPAVYMPKEGAGTLMGSVTSTTFQYPNNGISGNYWYIYTSSTTSYSQGSYIDQVESDNPSAYPDNGRGSDGYWYVKVES